MPRAKKLGSRSAAQKAQLGAVNQRKKENIPPNKRTKVAALEERTKVLAEQLQESNKQVDYLESTRQSVHADLEGRVTTLQGCLDESSQRRTQGLTVIKNLKRKLKRAEGARQRALEWRTSAQPAMSRLKNGRNGSYSADVRKMARLLVLNGCARDKVGKVLSTLAQGLGVKLKRAMSARTVGRTMVEGHIALTLSADGTSNRGINIDASHIAMRAPDYSSGSQVVQYSSKPKIRLLRVDSVVDHTAEGAVKAITARVSEAMDTFNRSPAAARLKAQVTIRHFLRILKGMNGDHANKEKSAAKGMEKLKHESAIEDLADTAVRRMDSLGNYVEYLQAWNQQKIAQHGGIEAWNSLSALEQARADCTMMDAIRKALGEEEYNELSEEERREIDLFIWAGCCMHKDQNSFQAGNTEMMAAWAAASLTLPILLANKGNAAVLRRILEPGANHTQQLSEDEQRAFEQSTRGGVKVAALAGDAIPRHQ